MICVYCHKPIVKYPAFSQYDPQWVHEFEGMPWGSERCEGASTIATPLKVAEVQPRTPNDPFLTDDRG